MSYGKRRVFVLDQYVPPAQRTRRSDDEIDDGAPKNYFDGCTPAVRDEGSGRFIANDVLPDAGSDDECTGDCEKLVTAETLNPAHPNGAHWFERVETAAERRTRLLAAGDWEETSLSEVDYQGILSCSCDDPLEYAILCQEVDKAVADAHQEKIVRFEQRKRAAKRLLRKSAAAHA